MKSFAKQSNALGTSTLKKTKNSWKPVFLISLRPFKIIDGTFLDPENFKKLKIKNLFEGDFFVSHHSLNLYLNEVIPDDKYKILKKAAINWKNTNINAHQNSEDFQHFCNRYKKGSSIFKNHFKGISKEYVPHNIIKYS